VPPGFQRAGGQPSDGALRGAAFYDSLLAKIIVRGADRAEAIDRMRRALRETVLEGVKTSIPFHLKLMDDAAFLEGRVSSVEMVRRRS